jgi:hypothetical protein
MAVLTHGVLLGQEVFEADIMSIPCSKLSQNGVWAEQALDLDASILIPEFQ